jgi:predicted small integral membrane protein
MHNLPKVYFKWTTAALHVLVMPMFFLAFSIVYQPFNMTELLDMGRGLYTLNISILFAIIFVLMAGMRSILRVFADDKHFTWAHYICWCIGECLVISLFASLYLSLISGGLYTFFNVLFKHVLLKSYLILIYPYLVLTLAFAVGAHRQAAKERDSADESLIRFYKGAILLFGRLLLA